MNLTADEHAVAVAQLTGGFARPMWSSRAAVVQWRAVKGWARMFAGIELGADP